MQLSDELRVLLWDVVHSFLLAQHDDHDQWTSGIAGRPAVRRVWAASPIHGDPQRMPEDVVELLEGWFSLVDSADLYAFVESVHDNLETPNQHRFANACNTALERGCADRRFVARRLLPIASRTDVTTVERALMACKPPHMADAEARLLDALDRFAQKVEPDFRGAVQEAIRAVEEATFVLTGDRPLSLNDALDDLESKGLVDPAIKAAYGGLSAYASTLFVRKTTQDDARLIIVMCAGFLSHLAAKM